MSTPCSAIPATLDAAHRARRRPSEVVPAIEKMLSTPAPVVLDVCVDKDECVFPMVPAGGANTEMILGPPTREAREKAARSQTGF